VIHWRHRTSALVVGPDGVKNSMNGAGLPYVVLTIQSPTVEETLKFPSAYVLNADPSVLRPSNEIPGNGDNTKSAVIVAVSVVSEIPRDEPMKPGALALSEKPLNAKPLMV
jgi:hypothetical protein